MGEVSGDGRGKGRLGWRWGVEKRRWGVEKRRWGVKKRRWVCSGGCGRGEILPLYLSSLVSTLSSFFNTPQQSPLLSREHLRPNKQRPNHVSSCSFYGQVQKLI